ncbi:hypothetical protein [Polaribacter butkevichii]|uniref:Uncharacterized protein n=1 Tax=Polaribacter butkevichii TaxID=218490 RepID=A0A2P6CDB9_9FLAO|nr:hypothetical protein [Polaribacter butkevichii]PQJ72893.1 hypothetical protein BTO14_06295 [Polaribacter butkevichii]
MSEIKNERGLHPLKGTVKTDEKDSDSKKSIVAKIDSSKVKDKLKNQIQSSTDEASEIAGKIKSSEKK